MIPSNPQKNAKYICRKCSAIFIPIWKPGELANCPKCGGIETEELVKTKTEVVQK